MPIEQADLDDLVTEQVADGLAQIQFEHLDAFGHAHLGQLLRGQRRQLAAGVVQGVELLLPLHQGGHVATDDGHGGLTIGAGRGRDVQVEMATAVAATKSRTKLSVPIREYVSYGHESSAHWTLANKGTSRSGRRTSRSSESVINLPDTPLEVEWETLARRLLAEA